MSLKIIGGKFRGRILKSIKGDSTRPTLALVRKAVFDMCQGIIEGATFLDLFAGSGAMGLEALSRGALSSTFVEKDQRAMNCIRENIALLGVEKKSKCYQKNAMSVINAKDVYDIIYIDPPYDLWKTKGQEIVEAIDKGGILAEGGLLFLEEAYPSSLDFSTLKTLEKKKERRYGNSLLHIFSPLR